MTTERELQHKERVAKGYEKLQGLKALYADWENFKEPDDPYMLHLKERIRKAETQLRNYGP